MSTPSEKVAEHVASALEGRIFRLEQEKAELERAQARIAEINDEITALKAEIAVQEPKRPRKSQEPKEPTEPGDAEPTEPAEPIPETPREKR